MVTKENYKMKHRLELLGIGAAKDRALKTNILEALRELAIEVPVEEVREIDRLLAYGISGIPALIVDGRVIFQKVVPSVEDLRLVLNILLKEHKQGIPFRNIIVPTDFSETAENAYRYALDLAQQLGGRIRLVHVHQAKGDLSGAVLLDGVTEELHYKQELLESLSQMQGHFSQSHEEKLPEVFPEMIRGSVVEELRDLSKQRETDLIVMGSTGESKFLKRWLGSISSEVARKAHCPVLLVPKNSRFRKTDDIVYACNYHSGEEEILSKIVHFTGQFDAALHLVHVDTVKGSSPLEGYQIPVGPVAEEGGVELRLSRVSNPSVLDGLTQYAKENKAGLMVLSTVHRPFFEDLFRRNLTREMAMNTSVPLLVLHFED